MLNVIIALISSFTPAHADAFVARVLVASTHEHQALVSLSNKDTIVFGQCDMPNYYEPTKDSVPVESFMSCKQLGETLPNKPEVRKKLETAFRTQFGVTFDEATGASIGTISRYSVVMGAITGGVVAGISYFFLPRLDFKGRAMIFGVTAASVTAATGYNAAKTAYAERGSATVLDQINKSTVMTSDVPLVIEEISELGLVSRRGFALARTAMFDAITAVAFELRGIVPGGGSSAGAGASSAW